MITVEFTIIIPLNKSVVCQMLFIINFRGNHTDRVITTGLFRDFWVGYIDIVNNVLLCSIDYPQFTETRTLEGQGMQMAQLYVSAHSTFHPDGNKMAVVAQNAGVISLSHIDEASITEFAQILYHPPSFRIADERNVGHGIDGNTTFTGIGSDERYIYVLYSGRSYVSHGMLRHYSEHLLVYDWEGNPVRRYILEVPMWSMSFDRETNSIYGIVYYPEGMFIRYQLSD